MASGGIRRTSERPKGLAPIFAVPKKDGRSYRVVHDLRRLNALTRYRPFRMETLGDWADRLKSYHWAATADLKEAFRHVSIAEPDQSWFGFRHRGSFYVHTALPFGWTSSPRLWGMVATALMEEAAARGVTAMIYVDDILVLGRTRDECNAHCQTIRTC